MEVVTGDHRFPLVANEAAKLIEAAVERLGYGVDEAVCIICQVAADYARSEYGNEYLAGLANVVISRGEMPLPPAENNADDRLSEAKECLETRDEPSSPPEDELSNLSGGWEPIETAKKDGRQILAAYAATGHMLTVVWDEHSASAGGWVDGATDADGDLITYPVDIWHPLPSLPQDHVGGEP